MTPTPLLLRAVTIAGGLSLAVAGGFAAYHSLSGAGAALDHSLMVPVAFTDASGHHTLLADTGRPADLRADLILHDRAPSVAAAQQSQPVVPDAAPPVMTAPNAASAAAPANIPPPAPAVTIVRTAPAPAVAVRTDDDEHHAARTGHDAERSSKHRGHGD